MAKTKEVKKAASLKDTLNELSRAYGSDNVKYGNWSDKNIDIIPTGAVTLDRAIGVGGIPRGRITVIYGHESSGKTTLASHVVANAQKQGLTAAIIDAEHAYDILYAKSIGVDREKLILLQPDSGEQAFSMMEKLIETGEVGLIVLDSIAAMVPQKELETGVAEMGGIARLMSAGLRRVSGTVRKNNVALVLINQVRMKIGVMYGNPETQPGGKAPMFAASVIIKVSKNGLQGEDKDAPMSIHTTAKVMKNKVAPPLRKAEFDIIFGKGIDNASCILDVAVETGIIEKQSSYFTIGDKKYSGREKAIAALKADEALFNEIYNKVMASDAKIEVVTDGEKVESFDADNDAEV